MGQLGLGHERFALGYGAGAALTTGSSNIDIGAAGAAGESGKIRIGTAGTQTATFIAGISGAVVTGAAVYVTTAGQLGVLASSERYKTAVAPMASTTGRLKELRPVTFRLKTDPKAGRQYGLTPRKSPRFTRSLLSETKPDRQKVSVMRNSRRCC